jgi:hypothetical protein
MQVIKARRTRWVWHVRRLEAREFLVGRPEGKRPLGKPSSRWDNNIKMDLKEVG